MIILTESHHNLRTNGYHHMNYEVPQSVREKQPFKNRDDFQEGGTRIIASQRAMHCRPKYGKAKFKLMVTDVNLKGGGECAPS